MKIAINTPAGHVGRVVADHLLRAKEDVVIMSRHPEKVGDLVTRGARLVEGSIDPWADLPNHYPSYQTCHRRFQGWVRSGTMKRILESLAANLRLRRDLDLREAFIDATFAPAKKGGLHVGKTKRGKGTKIMVVADRHGLPVAASIASASPHEVTLVGPTPGANDRVRYPRAPCWRQRLRFR